MGLQQTSIRVIDAGAPVGTQLHRIIRSRIISNDLHPGARISETEIAAAYGVSRQPVREAFIKLAEDGLLEVRPQRGTYVRKINVQAVMDARFVREAIEAEVVRLLASVPQPALMQELMAQIAVQREVLETNADAFMPLDDRFHRTLAEAAGKPFAWAVVDGMKSQMDRVRQLSTLGRRKVALIDHHTAIAQAIGAGNVTAADTAMRTHLREILTDLPAIRADLPEFFDETGAQSPL